MIYTDENRDQDLRIVNWLIRKKIKGGNLEFLADEMRQVAHIKLWELREKGQWKSVNYAITCAYYSMLNVWRNAKKHLDTKDLDLDLGGATRLEKTQASKITADDVLRGAEINTIIQNLIRRHSIRNQRLINMFLQDYKQREIAQAVNLSQTTVGQYIREFKRELAKELGIDWRCKNEK